VRTEELARLIAERRAALARLRELSVAQLQTVREGNFSTLFQLLAAKQQTLEAITELEERLAPFRDEDPDARAWSSAAQRERCAALWEESRQLLAAILADERLAETELSRRRAEVADQLRGRQAAGEARQAYLQAAAGRDLRIAEDRVA
jgi:hypothetical protein